jgi:hypothetical protein
MQFLENNIRMIFVTLKLYPVLTRSCSCCFTAIINLFFHHLGAGYETVGGGWQIIGYEGFARSVVLQQIVEDMREGKTGVAYCSFHVMEHTNIYND